jgi:hypothetical protein
LTEGAAKGGRQCAAYWTRRSESGSGLADCDDLRFGKVLVALSGRHEVVHTDDDEELTVAELRKIGESRTEGKRVVAPVGRDIARVRRLAEPEG